MRNVDGTLAPGAKSAVGRTTVIVDGGYRGTGLVIPHRRERGQAELPAWKQEHNASHRRVRARVEHAFALMETWKILRDCCLKGDGVQPRHARHRGKCTCQTVARPIRGHPAGSQRAL